MTDERALGTLRTWAADGIVYAILAPGGWSVALVRRSNIGPAFGSGLGPTLGAAVDACFRSICERQARRDELGLPPLAWAQAPLSS